nr:hypothetical protein [Tawny frogmouth aviadenovirus A]
MREGLRPRENRVRLSGPLAFFDFSALPGLPARPFYVCVSLPAVIMENAGCRCCSAGADCQCVESAASALCSLRAAGFRAMAARRERCLEEERQRMRLALNTFSLLGLPIDSSCGWCFCLLKIGLETPDWSLVAEKAEGAWGCQSLTVYLYRDPESGREAYGGYLCLERETNRFRLGEKLLPFASFLPTARSCLELERLWSGFGCLVYCLEESDHGTLCSRA